MSLEDITSLIDAEISRLQRARTVLSSVQDSPLIKRALRTINPGATAKRSYKKRGSLGLTLRPAEKKAASTKTAKRGMPGKQTPKARG